MKKLLIAASVISVMATACAPATAKAGFFSVNDTAATIESKQVNNQQKQYAKVQPVPFFDWSFERDQVIQLYRLRNFQAATHTVWRGDTSVIEGDCPSIGFGIPYDTSLTNPVTATDEDNYGSRNNALASIGQAEPNGVYASTNTSATWVMCVGPYGKVEPHYVEAKVTGYPYSAKVDYATGRVTRAAGAKGVSIQLKK